MPLTITSCVVDKKSIAITFSAPIVFNAADRTGTGNAANPANYSVFDPGSPDFNQPRTLDQVGSIASISLVGDSGVNLTFSPSVAGSSEFQPGDWVNIVVQGVQGTDGTALEPSVISLARQLHSTGKTGRLTRDVEDAISYPILTEEIGYRPSPVGIPTGGGIPGAGAAGGLGQVAAKAVSEVLGWKPNVDDPKGFVGALTQSFSLTDVEGHVEAKWTPRSYAVQTDIGGGITGAQASLYTRAKNALDGSLALLDGLYPLDPEADPEYVKALREMARSQMTEIVKELGVVGLPSILRIDTYFNILLGQNPAHPPAGGIEFDPDKIKGTLSELRDTYGIFFSGNPFNNSVEDEQDITNFRVISDYMTSLMQSWIANRNFFIVRPNQQAFFGTQLVLISRQFNVISETVDEVRFALDSVFIGPNERQTLLLEFSDPGLAPMFLEDALEEIKYFNLHEAPQLLRDGGKISVTNNILPVEESLLNLVEQAHVPTNIDDLPDGFKTARVRNSLDDLQDQLEALINLIKQVEQEVPPAEDKVTVSGITTPQEFFENDDDFWSFSIFGAGFDPAATVTVNSTIVSGIEAEVTFFSAQRIDARIEADDFANLALGPHDVTVTSGGQTATLANAFTIDNSGAVKLVARPALASKAPAKNAKAKTRKVTIGTSGVVRSVSPATPAAKPVPDATAAGLKKDVAELQKSQSELQKGHNEISAKLNEIYSKLNEALELNEAKAKAKSKHDKSS